MATTTAIRRCKGCIFWQPYNSEVANPAMRKMMNLQAPASKRHACTLRLRTKDELDDDGKPVQVASTDPRDDKGPRYGERVGPHGICDHHTPNHPPRRVVKTVHTDMAVREVVVDGPIPALTGSIMAEGTTELATVQIVA